MVSEEEFHSAASGDLPAQYVSIALKFLRERMEEAINARHITKNTADEWTSAIQGHFATVLGVSGEYIPPPERANLMRALGSIIITVYAAGARHPRFVQHIQSSRAKQMRAARIEKGKHDQRRDIIRAEVERAFAAAPELKHPRKISALARKIHPIVNDQLRTKLGKNHVMSVEAIRKQW